MSLGMLVTGSSLPEFQSGALSPEPPSLSRGLLAQPTLGTIQVIHHAPSLPPVFNCSVQTVLSGNVSSVSAVRGLPVTVPSLLLFC